VKSQVFVVDMNRQPLNPVRPRRARKLLKAGQAAVYRRYPFTIILRQAVSHPVLAPLRLKIDPGARTIGLALVNDATGEVVWAAELEHRGYTSKGSLDERRAVRRSRRSRHTCYRAPRWAGRLAGCRPP
jgi:hypothetical protein